MVNVERAAFEYSENLVSTAICGALGLSDIKEAFLRGAEWMAEQIVGEEESDENNNGV
jgi:hypothetical protein